MTGLSVAHASPADPDPERPGRAADERRAPTRSHIRTPVAALALTLLLVLLLSLMSGLLVWQNYRDTRNSSEADAENAAQVVAAHIQWLFEAGFQALRRVDEALGARPDLFIPGSAGDLGKAVEGLPAEIAIWVFDRNGVPLLTEAPAAPVADQPYFQALKSGDAWHISALLRENVTGQRAFAIGHRIERDGQFLGASVIFVPASLMSDFWRTLDLGPQSSVVLLRADGWLIARHPVPEDTISWSDSTLFTDYLPNAPAGAFTAASPSDGIERIYGYRTVPNLPLITVAGLSREAALERFRSRLELAATIAVPIFAALAAALWWVIRLLRNDERNRAELAQALDRNRMLFREIHHRVKNNLQIVSSLMKLQPGPVEAKQEMARRIAAMSAVHEHIYLSDQFSRVDLGDYVTRLVGNLGDSLGSTVTIDCDVAPLSAEADQALPLGLIINEVVTNAFKHAFPDGRAGRITVTLTLLDGERICLRVRDDGIGYGAADEPSGMGGRLLQGLARQLQAEYAFKRDGGTLFEMSFPLAQSGPAG